MVESQTSATGRTLRMLEPLLSPLLLRYTRSLALFLSKRICAFIQQGVYKMGPCRCLRDFCIMPRDQVLPRQPAAGLV